MQNPAIAWLYEPGSTFKLVTTAAGIEHGAFNANAARVPDPGGIDRGGWFIRNWNGAGHGEITPGQMLYYSSNIGAVHLNNLTGPAAFYQTVDQFGFGKPLGVNLSGEAGGIVYHPGDADWSELRFATNAYGQGIAVTPLQGIARWLQSSATTACQSCGMRCQICRARVCTPQTPAAQPRIISAQVAAQIREMLVASGSRYANAVQPDDLWLVPGYAIGAKTGTASIPLPTALPGGKLDDRLGGGLPIPADQPRYALLVVVVRPQGDVYGLQSALPTFRTLAAHLARITDVPPDPARVGPDQQIGLVQ